MVEDCLRCLPPLNPPPFLPSPASPPRRYCGCREQLTIDHVVPLSRGGGSSWENLVSAAAALVCVALRGRMRSGPWIGVEEEEEEEEGEEESLGGA